MVVPGEKMERVVGGIFEGGDQRTGESLGATLDRNKASSEDREDMTVA